MDDADARVTLGLLGAWALHDAEEVVMVPRWLRAHVPKLRERFPGVPDRVWRRLESIDEHEFRVAVTGMGVLIAASAAHGHRTGGRSAAYQTALLAFGLHGAGHLALSGAVRGYTPGAATSAMVVVPFTLWARNELRRAGVLRSTRTRDIVWGVALTAAALTATHTLAQRLTHGRQRNR
ncbi:membrane protein [Actinomadura sp. NBRC 104412]|uniref:HXXEE domain-containing protein n=1 Tax=Actinomadura sp. NBRC 104412 TaxID=3032203 RepID=UPI0024A00D8D|nr:HXXEE domain-containing protein [Actinomadura sp. NBRC 104412]GLZ06193.1 membrane protein [Actinomadura sp. NBRC 104412]